MRLALESEVGEDGRHVVASAFSLTDREKATSEQWISLWERAETTPEEAVAMADNPKRRVAITMTVERIRQLRTDLDEEARLDVLAEPWSRYYDEDGAPLGPADSPPGSQGHCALEGLGLKAPRPLSKAVMKDLRRRLLDYINEPGMDTRLIDQTP